MSMNDLLKASCHTSRPLAAVRDAEILTVAIVAAAYFHNHHERALWDLHRLSYLSASISTSRFNRRLHQLAHWLEALLQVTAFAGLPTGSGTPLSQGQRQSLLWRVSRHRTTLLWLALAYHR